MSRAMKERSVAMELPASGAVLGCLDVFADVVEHHCLGGRQVNSGGLHLVDKSRARVHLGHHVDHRRQRGVVGMYHHVDSVAENVQVGVGHQSGDFNQLVRAQVQPGHLAVDPHQFFTHSGPE